MTVLDHENQTPADGQTTPCQGASEAAHQAPLFEEFFRLHEPRLRRALVALYGSERGREATAEALAYAWETWPRVRDMQNPSGYLFRVAQSRSRTRQVPVTFDVDHGAEHDYEPKLLSSLQALSTRQRLAVVLVHGFGWTLREAADLMGTKPTTVQNHLDRGLRRLRTALGVHDEH